MDDNRQRVQDSTPAPSKPQRQNCSKANLNVGTGSRARVAALLISDLAQSQTSTSSELVPEHGSLYGSSPQQRRSPAASRTVAVHGVERRYTATGNRPRDCPYSTISTTTSRSSSTREPATSAAKQPSKKTPSMEHPTCRSGSQLGRHQREQSRKLSQPWLATSYCARKSWHNRGTAKSEMVRGPREVC